MGIDQGRVDSPAAVGLPFRCRKAGQNIGLHAARGIMRQPDLGARQIQFPGELDQGRVVAVIADRRLMPEHFVRQLLLPDLHQRNRRPDIFMPFERMPVGFFERVRRIRSDRFHAEGLRGQQAVKAVVETGRRLQLALHSFRLPAFEIGTSAPVEARRFQIDIGR